MRSNLRRWYGSLIDWLYDNHGFMETARDRRLYRLIGWVESNAVLWRDEVSAAARRAEAELGFPVSPQELSHVIEITEPGRRAPVVAARSESRNRFQRICPICRKPIWYSDLTRHLDHRHSDELMAMPAEAFK